MGVQRPLTPVVFTFVSSVLPPVKYGLMHVHNLMRLRRQWDGCRGGDTPTYTAVRHT
jgi:hypothetical protein